MLLVLQAGGDMKTDFARSYSYIYEMISAYSNTYKSHKDECLRCIKYEGIQDF